MNTDKTTAEQPTASEPWAIWGGIVLVILVLAVAVLTMGMPGLVVMMVLASIGFLGLLCAIVFG